jgi:predicted lipoprotein with Yx(FWY)xxD motif
MSLFPGSRAILTSVAVIAIVAGCSNGASASPQATLAATTPEATGATSPGATAAAATPGASSAAEVYEVDVVTDALGAHITGEDGRTLYLRTSDPAGGSSCTGNCATTWPPFTLDTGETVTAGTGVTGALTTFARSDGSTQVLIDGHALYYYSGDSAAGDTTGQGIGGVWFVVSPAGAKVG